MKFLILFVLATVLFACSNDNSSNPPIETTESEGEHVGIDGAAIKGVIRYAKVDLFLQENGQFVETAVSSEWTDENGFYRLKLPASSLDYTGPIKIVLTALNNSQQKCDVPAGCYEGTLYGEFYGLPEGFQLSAIGSIEQGLKTVEGNTIQNLSAVTSIAAKYIEAQGSVSVESIETGNNQIRAVLGLPEDVSLSATKPMDITDSTDFGNSVYGAINAAFLSLYSSNVDNPLVNGSFDEKLDAIASQLVSTNGQILQKSTNADDFSIEKLTNEIINMGTLEGDELADIQAEYTEANTQAAGTYTNITSPVISLSGPENASAGDVVSFNISTVSGAPTSYKWVVLEGPLSLIDNSSAATEQLSFTAPDENTIISLMAIGTDDNGHSANALTSVQVEPNLATSTADSGNYVLSSTSIDLIDEANVLSGHFSWLSQAIDLQLSSDGEGTISGIDHSGNQELTTDIELFTGQDPNNISDIVITRENQSNDVGTFSMPIVAYDSGRLEIDVPSQFFIESNKKETLISHKLKFFKVANGLFSGSKLARIIETDVNGENINGPESRHLIETGLLHLTETTTLNNWQNLANKEYVGISLIQEVELPKRMYFGLKKSTVVFNDDASQMTSTGDTFQITGAWGRPTQGFGGDLSGEIILHDPELIATSQLNMNQGHFSNMTSGETFINGRFTNSLKAFSLQELDYFNDSSVDYEAVDALVSRMTSGIFLEKNPNLDLSGKTFKFRNYSYQASDSNTDVQSATEIGFSEFDGEFTIQNNELSFTSYERKAQVKWDDDKIPPYLSEGLPVTEGTVTIKFEPSLVNHSGSISLATSITDADGCLQVESNFELCFGSEGGLIGRKFKNEMEVNSVNLSIDYFVGQEI